MIENGADVYAERDGETILTALCKFQEYFHEMQLRIVHHLIINHKVALKMPVEQYTHLILDLVLGRAILGRHPGSTGYDKKEFAKKGEDDLSAIMKTLLSNVDLSSRIERDTLSQALVRICAWYDGENILHIIRLLCDHGAEANVLCDGSVRPQFCHRGYLTYASFNCMKLIRHNRKKKCTEDEALSSFPSVRFQS